MHKIIGLLFLGLVALWLMAPVSAKAEPCLIKLNTVGMGVWNDIQPDNISDDPYISSTWCGTPHAASDAAFYTGALRLPASYWDEVFVLEGNNVCRPETHGNRVINAAAFLHEMWKNRGTTTLRAQNARINWLIDYIYPGTKGHIATCEVSNSNAENPVGGDDPVKLHQRWFWANNVAERASTLVHENAHELVGHLDDAECNGSPSCDNCFQCFQGPIFPIFYNAQTYSIWTLGEAVDTYRRDTEDPNNVLQIVNMGTALDPGHSVPDVCGFMPMLSPLARQEAVINMQNRLSSHFAAPLPPSQYPYYARMSPTTDPFYDYGGMEFESDKPWVWDARWPCGHICNPVDHDFSAGGKHACNEDFQPENAAINILRRQKCEEVEAEIAQGVSRQEWDHLRADWGGVVASQRCIPGYSEEYLEHFCADTHASSNDVADIRTLWEAEDLPDFPGYTDVIEELQECQMQYCADQFEPQWIEDARNACYEWSDTGPGFPGCLDELCGNLLIIGPLFGNLSQEYFDAVYCRMDLVETIAVGGSFGQPDAAQCENLYQTCKKRKAFEAWAAAKSQGQCTLVDGTNIANAALATVTLPSIYISTIAPIRPLISSIKNLDYTAFKIRFPNAQVDECAAEISFCEAVDQITKEWATEFLLVTEIPDHLLWPEVLPGEIPLSSVLPEVDYNVRRLAQVAVNGPDGSGLSRQEAMRRLSTIPEAMHSLSNALGKEAFFALFGVKGRSPIFGSEAVERYKTAEVRFHFSLNDEQQLLLPQLLAVKELRVRAESAATQSLIEAAAVTTTQETFYNFIHNAANSAGVQEMNQHLDQLPLLGQ